MEHQWPVLGAQARDQLERFIRGEDTFDHGHHLVIARLDRAIQ
jgi:hypothetical protein